MYRSDEEKLTDIMLGEAVLVLLRGRGPVNHARLIELLRSTAASEVDVVRKRACERAISELHNSIAASGKRMTHVIRDRDNVRHLFSSEGPPDGTNTH